MLQSLTYQITTPRRTTLYHTKMPVRWTDRMDRHLLLCVLAANPTVSIDGNELATLCGSTNSGVMHRLLKLKKESQQILKGFF